MTTAGNTSKGRMPGARNKRTVALMALAEDGETPGAFALRMMRDEEKPDELRMHAARLAAPLVHPKPQPEPRYVKGFGWSTSRYAVRKIAMPKRRIRSCISLILTH